MQIETFEVGDTIYYPTVHLDNVPTECPDCHDTRVWKVETATQAFEIACPRCHRDNQFQIRAYRKQITLHIRECRVHEVLIRQAYHRIDGLCTIVSYQTSAGTLYQDRSFATIEEAGDHGIKMLACRVEEESQQERDVAERQRKRAGQDILALMRGDAETKLRDLQRKLDDYRDKLREAIEWPTLYGPPIHRPSYGSPEITSRGLAEWLDEKLTDAGLDGWTEGEMEEMLCSCA